MTSGLEWADSSRSIALGGASAQAGPRQIDIGFFYEELAPYGYWSRHELYGWVWYPADVDDEWRPYTVGYWVFTDDYGWTWVSEEPWGWMTYHYGRWFYDNDYGGWAWIPGTVWGPAWVSWRSGDGVVGWAPLPPDVYFDPVVGFSQSGANFQISWFAWSFVSEPELLSHRVHRSILPRPHNRAMIGRTRHFTDYKVIDRRIVNRGIDIDRYERDHRTRVTRYHAIDVDRPTVDRGSKGEGNIPLFRPSVLDKGADVRPPESAMPLPSAIRRREAVPRDFRNEVPEKPWGERKESGRPDAAEAPREYRQRPAVGQPEQRGSEPFQPPEAVRRAVRPEPPVMEPRREYERSPAPEVRRAVRPEESPPEPRREYEQSPSPEVRRAVRPESPVMNPRREYEQSPSPEVRRALRPESPVTEPRREYERSPSPEVRRAVRPESPVTEPRREYERSPSPEVRRAVRPSESPAEPRSESQRFEQRDMGRGAFPPGRE